MGHADAAAFHGFFELYLGQNADAVETSLDLLNAAIEGGSDIGYVLRAIAIQRGWGDNADTVGAQQDFRRAHDRGIAVGSTLLGLSQRVGLGGPIDAAGGRALIEQAASRGEPLARYLLAVFDMERVSTGAPGAPSPEAVFHRSRESVNDGVPTAASLYAFLLYAGFGTDPDPLAARDFLDQMADEGDQAATFYRALIIELEAAQRGEPIPQEAVETFIALADADFSPAREKAAHLAANEIGMATDVDRAAAYARRGSELGDALATMYYGQLLLGEHGHKIDVAEAIAQYERAAAMGAPPPLTALPIFSPTKDTHPGTPSGPSPTCSPLSIWPCRRHCFGRAASSRFGPSRPARARTKAFG